jgi:anti-sigma B factor antagonist
MGEVPFIDSSGLSALVSGLKGARKEGGIVVLCNVQPQARTIFSLTMLDKVFSIYPDVQTAMDSFG